MLGFTENESSCSKEDITGWLQVAGAEFGFPNTPAINQTSSNYSFNNGIPGNKFEGFSFNT